MADRVIVWDDFSAGEYGSLGPRNAPVGSFHGLNLVRYLDGSVGPRCGWSFIRTLATTGRIVLTAGAAHNVRFPGPNPDFPVYLVTQGDTAYRTTFGGTNESDVDAALNDLDASPMIPLALNAAGADDPEFWFSQKTSGIWALEESAGALIATQKSSAADGEMLVLYRDRLVCAAWDDNRIRFSEPFDHANWPSTNFIDIGADEWGIRGMWVQRDHLAILKGDGSWWIITGALSVNEVIRRVVDGPPPAPIRGVATPNGEIWYFRVAQNAPVGNYPGVFTGAEVKEQSHLRVSDQFLQHKDPTVITLGGFGDLMVAVPEDTSGTGALTGPIAYALRQQGVWTLHRTAVNVFSRPQILSLYGNRALFIDNSLADNTTPFTQRLYGTNLGLSRPPVVGTAAAEFETQTDDGNTFPTSLELPQWWSDDGSEVNLRSLVVDFKTYSSSSGPNNHFDVLVEAHGAYETSPRVSATQSFDVAPAGGIAGTEQTRVFNFGDQGPGRGLQVKFAALRGVAIRSVMAIVSTDPTRSG